MLHQQQLAVISWVSSSSLSMTQSQPSEYHDKSEQLRYCMPSYAAASLTCGFMRSCKVRKPGDLRMGLHHALSYAAGDLMAGGSGLHSLLPALAGGLLDEFPSTCPGLNQTGMWVVQPQTCCLTCCWRPLFHRSDVLTFLNFDVSSGVLSYVGE